MNPEAEKGQAADPQLGTGPFQWASFSFDWPHQPWKVWNFKMTSSAFSNQPGGLNSEGAFMMTLLQLAGVFRWMEGRRSSAAIEFGRRRGSDQPICTTLYIWGGGFDTNWKQNLFCHKRLSITHRESDYGWLSTDLVIHEGDWQHKRRHEWRDKKERSKETRHRPVTCTLLILETDLLLEWSVRSCPSVTFLASARRSSLCGGKLLGLCPYPLLIVHPVLTEAHERRTFEQTLLSRAHTADGAAGVKSYQ